MSGGRPVPAALQAQLDMLERAGGGIAWPEAAFKAIRAGLANVAPTARHQRALEYTALAVRLVALGPQANPAVMQLGILVHDLEASRESREAPWVSQGSMRNGR